MNNKVEFKINDVEYAVKRPTLEVEREAQSVYAHAWKEAAESGNFILREKLFSILAKHDLWDDQKQKTMLELQTFIKDSEDRLNAGGVKLSEGRKLALEISNKRQELKTLLVNHGSYDNMTAEAQAQNARFNFLVSKCLIDNKKGLPVYKDLDDYVTNSATDLANKGATLLAEMLYGLSDDFEKKLPENKFLIKYGFMNNELRLVNKQGKYIDEDGRLVDKDGFFIKETEDGQIIKVNRDGVPVDSEGNRIIEAKPFLDDETGLPIEENPQTT